MRVRAIGPFYYRISADSDGGQLLNKYIEDVKMVDKAADDFAKQLGAETYIAMQDAGAGGVSMFTFPEDHVLSPDDWMLAYNPDEVDGIKYFIPKVEKASAWMPIDVAEAYQKDNDGKTQDGKVTWVESFIERAVPFDINKMTPNEADLQAWSGVTFTQGFYPVLATRRKWYDDKQRAAVGTFDFENPTDEQLETARNEFIQAIVRMSDRMMCIVITTTGTQPAIDVAKQINALPIITADVLPRLLMAAPHAKKRPSKSPSFFRSEDGKSFYFMYGLPCNIPDRQKITKRLFEAELGKLNLDAQNEKS